MRATKFNPTHYLSDTTDDGWSGPVEIQTGPAADQVHDGEALVWNGRNSILCRKGQLLALAGHAHTERWNHPIRTERGGDVEATECELCRRPIRRRIVDALGNWSAWELADDVEAFAAQLVADTAADQVDQVDRDQVTDAVGMLADHAAHVGRMLTRLVRERDALRAERDTARSQRDALTEQLDAALDDRDRARFESAKLAGAIRALMIAEPTAEEALDLIGGCVPGGPYTGKALAEHAAGRPLLAIRWAARQIAHQAGLGSFVVASAPMPADVEASIARARDAWSRAVAGVERAESTGLTPAATLDGGSEAARV